MTDRIALDKDYSTIIYILKNIPYCIRLLEDDIVQLKNRDYNLEAGIYCKFKYNIQVSLFIDMIKEHSIQSFHLCVPIYLKETDSILWEEYFIVDGKNFCNFLKKGLQKSYFDFTYNYREIIKQSLKIN